MDLLGSITGGSLFEKDIPSMVKSLERIAVALEKLAAQTEIADYPSELGTPPWRNE